MRNSVLTGLERYSGYLSLYSFRYPLPSTYGAGSCVKEAVSFGKCRRISSVTVGSWKLKDKEVK